MTRIFNRNKGVAMTMQEERPLRTGAITARYQRRVRGGSTIAVQGHEPNARGCRIKLYDSKTGPRRRRGSGAAAAAAAAPALTERRLELVSYFTLSMHEAGEQLGICMCASADDPEKAKLEKPDSRQQ